MYWLGARVDDGTMANTFEPTPVPPDSKGREWPRSLYGMALLAFGGLALVGVIAGVGSQIVVFAEYDRHVEAELYRPLIVPCLVAVVATGAGAVAWWLAFARRSAPPWAPAPFLAVILLSLGAAFTLQGPSEAELERRWSDRLRALQLPAGFASVEPDAPVVSGDYRAARQWTTAEDPAAACPSLQQAVSAWFGVSVHQQPTDGCFLSAVDGKDLVRVDIHRTDATPAVTLVTVSMSYST